ncbi:MAG: hypothetical protein RI907_324 [Pseudomonadota bacterium]
MTNASSASRLASLRDAVFITAATYLTTGLGLLVSTMAARSLGPETYGKYAYLVWLSGLLVTCSNHGLGISGIRFVSEYLGRGQADVARRIHGWLLHWQGVSTVAVLALFSATCWYMPLAGWETQRPLMLGVILFGVGAKAAYLFDVSIAKGHKLFKIEAITNSTMSLIYAASVAMMAWLNADLSSFAIGFGVVSFLHIIMVRLLMRNHGIQADKQACPPEVIERIKPHLAWTVVLVAVGTLSNKTLETFILGTWIGPAEVGYFTIAATLTKGGIDVLSSALTAMLMPMMAHAYGEGGVQRVNIILRDSVRYFLFFGLVIGGIGVLWAEPGVLLLYGHRYDAVIPALQAMVIVGGLTLPEGAFGALLSTTDHQKLRATIVGLSAVISAASAIILVPTQGLTGALWSVAITRFVILLITGAAIRRALQTSFPYAQLLRLLASAVVAGALSWGLLWLLGHHVAAQLASGLVYLGAFLTMTIWLQAWTRKDAEVLTALAERKPKLFGRLTPRLRRWTNDLP